MRAGDLDLREILSFQPRGGVIRFMGRRVVLLDAAALGLLRKELVSTLGLYAARGILTRLGFGHGWRVAEAMKQEQPELWAEGKAGPHLPGLAGQFVLEHSLRSAGAGTEPLVQTSWKESYEAEQHLVHFGRAEEPVCWMAVGFAGGLRVVQGGAAGLLHRGPLRRPGRPALPRDGALPRELGARARAAPRVLRAGVDRRRPEPGLDPPAAHRAQAPARRQELGILEDGDQDASGIVARSEAMRRALDQARRFAHTDSSVLLTGESGVGKEVVARFIHAQSSRAGKPFIALNCGAVPETLLESELFGHARGAFTGAQATSIASSRRRTPAPCSSTRSARSRPPCR